MKLVKYGDIFRKNCFTDLQHDLDKCLTVKERVKLFVRLLAVDLGSGHCTMFSRALSPGDLFRSTVPSDTS